MQFTHKGQCLNTRCCLRYSFIKAPHIVSSNKNGWYRRLAVGLSQFGAHLVAILKGIIESDNEVIVNLGQLDEGLDGFDALRGPRPGEHDDGSRANEGFHCLLDGRLIVLARQDIGKGLFQGTARLEGIQEDSPAFLHAFLEIHHELGCHHVIVIGLLLLLTDQKRLRRRLKFEGVATSCRQDKGMACTPQNNQRKDGCEHLHCRLFLVVL